MRQGECLTNASTSKAAESAPPTRRRFAAFALQFAMLPITLAAVKDHPLTGRWKVGAIRGAGSPGTPAPGDTVLPPGTTLHFK